LNAKEDLKQRGHHPAILLISQEPYLLKEKEEEIRDNLIPPESRDLNLRVLYGWEARITEVIEFLQTMPFLASRRLLVLRELHSFTELKPLTEYLQNPNPASCLLMTSSEMKRTDSRFKSISAYADSSELKKPSGRDMIRWVERRFAESDKSIDHGLAEILLQVTGEDMAILATEIGKVILSSGEREKILDEDLSVSVPGGVEIVFTLLDAIGDGDTSVAMGAMKKLLESDNPPEYLIHMLAWHYRQLLRGRELVDSGLSPVQAAEKMGKRYKSLKDKFARHLGRATETGLVRAMKTLSDCDLELKRGRVPDEILLDRLVLDLLL
jgi:DNA polymerase-3 subunit delta